MLELHLESVCVHDSPMPGNMPCECHVGPELLLIAQNLMERAVVLGLGTGQPQASPALTKLVTRYADILASQVLLTVGNCRKPALMSCVDQCFTMQKRCWPSASSKLYLSAGLPTSQLAAVCARALDVSHRFDHSYWGSPRPYGPCKIVMA